MEQALNANYSLHGLCTSHYDVCVAWFMRIYIPGHGTMLSTVTL